MTSETKELAVRRSIEIDAPPERVWEEIADPERFRLWYTPAGGVEMPCKRVEYEPRVGGIFETAGHHDWGSGRIDFHFTGEVLVFDPPRELTVSMKAEDEEMPGVCSLSFSWHRSTVVSGPKCRLCSADSRRLASSRRMSTGLMKGAGI